MNAITGAVGYGQIIHDAVFTRVVALPFFAGCVARKNKALQIQTQSLPYIGVYQVSEKGRADGDADVGDIRFIHNLRLGFSYIIAINDPAAAEDRLNQSFREIMNGLLCDDTLTNRLRTTLAENTRIEGFPDFDWKKEYGNAGLNGETPYGESKFEMTFTYRSMFSPPITDDLRRISVETGFEIGETEEEMAERPQVHVEYLFDDNGDPIELPLPPSGP